MVRLRRSATPCNLSPILSIDRDCAVPAVYGIQSAADVGGEHVGVGLAVDAGEGAFVRRQVGVEGADRAGKKWSDSRRGQSDSLKDVMAATRSVLREVLQFAKAELM